MSRSKDRRELARIAERMGYCYDGMTKGGHLRWRNRHGIVVITGSSIPAGHHLANAVGQLRKAQDQALPILPK